MGLGGAVPLALDVACGTGQSAVALTAVAEQVVGIDISRSMLANVEPNERIRLAQARAEAIPIRSSAVSIVSTGLAFHWFDRHLFLQEAWRVLEDDGFLMIYNNGFSGRMKENPAFQDWSHGAYQDRFPAPSRDRRPFTADEAAASGFASVGEERYENEVRFTPETLVAYLMTQTNVVAAIDEGRERLGSAQAWLLEQVRPYFTTPDATFIFVTRAWYARKIAAG
ncbi:MAG: class I SAM-dependent methyltransferase [Chloroflexota bacterium]